MKIEIFALKVSLLTALYAGRYDFGVALLIALFSGCSYERVRKFTSAMYRRYAFSRLNHTIKVAIASKSELTQSHVDPIAMRKWKEVLAWITFQPNELFFVDRRKQTALHLCCLFRAPAVVIEMILFQAPELASMKNKDGEIPLNWAVRLSAPNEVLQLLLSVDPESGCTSKDKEGNTALSLIWERHSEVLLDTWWQEGKDKLTESNWWKRIIFLLECYHKSIILKARKCCHGDEIVDHEETEPCNDQYDFLPLHTATRCPQCPVSLYPLLLKVYYHQIRQKDWHGRLPLAVACLDALSNRSSGVLTKIQVLLQENPHAANIRDHQGRLPLFIALESGIVIDEGISELLSASPKSLILFDPVTRLSPFMLAAIGAKKRAEKFRDTINPATAEQPNDCHLDDVRSLSTIFTLLRAEPSQLSLQRNLVEDYE